MIKKRRSKKSYPRQDLQFADYLLVGTVLLLTIFGVFMVYNTSVVVAYEQWDDKYLLFWRQLTWAIIGIPAGFVVSRINYQVWKKYVLTLSLLTLIALILVFIPGLSSETYGARTRLALPFSLPGVGQVPIQPSEAAKLTLIMYLATLFSRADDPKKKGFPHIQFLIITGLTTVLIALEPDLGNALLVAGSAFVVYFAAGAHLLVVSGVLTFGGLAALLFTLTSTYRRERILTFLNPLADPQGASYQIQQILIALGSGGILGLGLGNSRQKYQYIPEVVTDSIFAVIGEELGFVGAVLILGALFFIVWRGLSIARNTKDKFGQLLAAGITANIGFQAVVNLGGMVGLIPLTGVPLPFISYGGSSLTFLLVSIGILLNISHSNRGSQGSRS